MPPEQPHFHSTENIKVGSGRIDDKLLHPLSASSPATVSPPVNNHCDSATSQDAFEDRIWKSSAFGIYLDGDWSARTPSSALHDCSGLRRPSVASSRSESSGSSVQELNDKSWFYPLDSFADGTRIISEEENIKHTWILDAEGEVVAEIIFTGPSPTAIKLAGHKPIYGRFCTTGLFPSMEDQLEEFRAGTRVEDLEWVVTKSALELVTSDDEPAITYHTNCRIDSGGKVRSTFLRGTDFVEFFGPLDELCKEDMAELMATFCLMELFRRGRFRLTPYVFDATSAFQRYHAIIRDNYIGAASWRLRQVFGRARSTTL
ncbi:hypothetical protein BU17DRAFT_97497 [Hysterangium stoloniferum]|nr:hypothetical protein BU17DRAFT_97497 [Hysterangium stoloniferum]